MKVTLDIESVQVLCPRYGTDKVILNLSDETARFIHGDKYDLFRGASLQIDVTKGRGKTVALTFCDTVPVEVINC